MALYVLYALYAALTALAAWLSFYVWPGSMAFVSGMVMAMLLSFVAQLIYDLKASRREMREVQRKLKAQHEFMSTVKHAGALGTEYGQANKHGRH